MDVLKVGGKRPCRLCEESKGKCPGPGCYGFGYTFHLFSKNKECNMCKGTGLCPACGGKGWV